MSSRRLAGSLTCELFRQLLPSFSTSQVRLLSRLGAVTFLLGLGKRCDNAGEKVDDQSVLRLSSFQLFATTCRPLRQMIHRHFWGGQSSTVAQNNSPRRKRGDARRALP